MGGDPITHSVELTQQAEKKLENHPTWAQFLRKAIDKLAFDPEPDGLTKFVGPETLGVSGLLLNDVFPWRITYQMVGPDRVIIVSIEIHPVQQMML